MALAVNAGRVKTPRAGALWEDAAGEEEKGKRMRKMRLKAGGSVTEAHETSGRLGQGHIPRSECLLGPAVAVEEESESVGKTACVEVNNAAHIGLRKVGPGSGEKERKRESEENREQGTRGQSAGEKSTEKRG